MNEMAEKMQAGSQSGSRKIRSARDFDADFKGAQHISADGWNGIPASAFRSAAIAACRMVGLKMTHAKMSIFVDSEGYDRDGTPLVRIYGDFIKSEMPVRLQGTTVDIRVRPLWVNWTAAITVRFDADQFSADDVVNLFFRAGQQVGIGEGRAFSKTSDGLGYGMFTIKSA